jgi:hypothetical protein
LAPVLGDVLTRASIRLHCQRLGIVGAEVDVEQLAELLAALDKGMRVFLGAQRAREIIGDLELALLRGDA